METNTLEGLSASPSYWERFLKIVLGVFVVLLILLIILAAVITLTSETVVDLHCFRVELEGHCLPGSEEPVE